MDWIELVVHTTTEGAESVSFELIELGSAGTMIEDRADIPDPGKPHGIWEIIDPKLIESMPEDVQVHGWFEDDGNGKNAIAGLHHRLEQLHSDHPEFGTLQIDYRTVSDDTWKDTWKKYYKPFNLGQKLLIKPEWEELDSEAVKDKVVLSMNPGHLFGTGTHYSTQLCMIELEKYIRKGDRVLDLGCGSGILSILSLLLGADSAVAVDIDPAAPATAMENLAMNGISPDRYSVLVGNVIDDQSLRKKIGGGYDVVVANIVADVIIAMSRTAYEQTRSGGIFITSGIIGPRAEEVKTAVSEAGFSIIDIHDQSDWVCITARKN